MGREKLPYKKERINVWILPNQLKDIEHLKEVMGKNKTDVVIEALGIYLNMLRKQGVI